MVFQPALHAAWWRVLSGRRYAHCWVMWAKYYPAPALTAVRWTTKLEAVRGGLAVDVWWEDPDVVAGAFAPHVTEILRLTRRVRLARSRLRGLINCVTAVKALLDINAPLVLSPRQLREHLLLRCGARRWEGRHG